MRKCKRERWTRQFKAEEENDRNNRALYPFMPSPLGRHWLLYIKHRLKMLRKGVHVYTKAKYARLNLDRYIQTNRLVDKVAIMLTENRPSLIHFGAAKISPNLPFKIKKHIRCPGSRKLIGSFKKQGTGCVVLPANEEYTSQTCPRCLGRFNPTTKSHRFKVCQNCHPCHEAMLPTVIVTKKGNRERKFWKNNIDIIVNQIEPRPSQQVIERLLSKVQVYPKKWRVNPITGEMENVIAVNPDELDEMPRGYKSVHNRDIAAAKCILIKGMY